MADKIEIVRPDEAEMCPVGLHVVKGHTRICKSGRETWVDPHPAKNRTHDIIVLLEENLQFIYWHNLQQFPNLPTVFGFSSHNELDKILDNKIK